MSFPKAHPGLRVGGNLASDVVCEIFVDFACPYSRKMVQALAPIIDESKGGGDVCYVFYNVMQPWHHQSLWLHETSFAVKMVCPEQLWTFWKALFENAPEWYDKEIFTLNRPEFYNKISAFAAGVCCATDGDADKEQLKMKLLQWLIPPMQLGGSFPDEAKSLGATPNDDENALFPYTRQTVKFHRKRGVHVTPTVFFNGIEQAEISSSWDTQKWKSFVADALSK
jgi:hypothetical protein